MDVEAWSARASVFLLQHFHELCAYTRMWTQPRICSLVTSNHGSLSIYVCESHWPGYSFMLFHLLSPKDRNIVRVRVPGHLPSVAQERRTGNFSGGSKFVSLFYSLLILSWAERHFPFPNGSSLSPLLLSKGTSLILPLWYMFLVQSYYKYCKHLPQWSHYKEMLLFSS